MADADQARRLRERKREDRLEEEERIGESLTADEELLHRRRADRAAYLERKLAERERSERDAGGG